MVGVVGAGGLAGVTGWTGAAVGVADAVGFAGGVELTVGLGTLTAGSASAFDPVAEGAQAASETRITDVSTRP